MGSKDWMNYVLEKMKELLVLLENFWGSLVGKADEVFPPGTREEKLIHWLQVATPYLIAGAVVLILCTCCYCCCCRGGGRSVKMMKAPGRNYRMPRHTFESNPRSYFRDLRGKSIDQLV